MADSTDPSAKTPRHLWVIGVVALLWNSVGALDFVMTQTRNEAYLKGLTAAQRDYYLGYPLWVVVAWGIAVWGGVLGSLLLLLRRRVAIPLFLASVACIVLTDIYIYALSGGLKIMGTAGDLAFGGVILLIGMLLLAYARGMGRSGVLR